MATTPIDHIHPGHLGATYVSEESPFGTTGTERRCWPLADTVEVQTTQESVDAKTLSPIPFDAETPILGNKGGTAKLSLYLQPGATVNTTSATPDTDAANPLRVFLRCLFGGEDVSAGSTVATGTSETAITVDTGHGARMVAGKLVAVSTNGTVGHEVAQVRSRSTDDLTLYPALSATPATGRAVVSLNTYYPSRTNSRSLSLAVTGQNTDRQVRLNGCTGSLALRFERNALALAEVDLTAATHTGPSALSLSAARSEDTAAAPLSVRNVTCYLQPVATTTRDQQAVDAVAMTLNFGNMHVASLTGTLEGKRGVHRGENLIDSFASVELTLPDATEPYSWYAAGTELSFWFVVSVDVSASSRRFVVVHLPQCVVDRRPEEMKGEGNLKKLKVTLRAKLSEQCTGTLDTEALAQSPFVLGLG